MGDAGIAVRVPGRVGSSAVGTVQSEVRGLVKADRAVEGITVVATLSGLTVGTATVDGRSGTFAFPFAVRHLADNGPHTLTVTATSSDATVTTKCPDALAGITLSVDPLSTLALGPEESTDDSLAGAAVALPGAPTIAVDPANTNGLSFAASMIATLQQARGGVVAPRVVPMSESGQSNSSTADVVVVSSPDEELATQPDIGAQPLRLPAPALRPPSKPMGSPPSRWARPEPTDTDRSSSAPPTRWSRPAPPPSFVVCAGHRRHRLASSSAIGQSTFRPTPSRATRAIRRRGDASERTRPGLPGAGFVGTSPLDWDGGRRCRSTRARIIVRTHRTVSRVPDRPRD